MKNRIVVAVLAAVAVLGLAASPAAAAVPAGNGTSNFYLTGSCSAGNIGGVTLKLTNYDNGSGQVYHTAWTRTGPAYGVLGIYVDGVYKTKASDAFIPISGHGAHTVKIVFNVFGDSSRFTCSIRK